MYDYFGEAAGGRIVRYGNGYTQVGTAYNLEVRTWPARPAGEDGECLCRCIIAVLRHTNGYSVQLAAVVDDAQYPFATFGGGPPPGGQLEQVVRCRLPVMVRGNRIEAVFNTLVLAGEIELLDLAHSSIPIRATQ